MTTAAAANNAAPERLEGIHSSFPRLVHSEWIKLITVRSTLWCFLILFALNIGLPLLVAETGAFGESSSGSLAGSIAVTVMTLGVNFTSLIVAVIGVLIISGEYTTGMIRSTFTANPRRVGTIVAKAFVLAFATFVVSAASTWIAAFAIRPVLAGQGVDFSLSDPKVFLPLLGSSVYAVLIALLSLGVGTLLRTTAGGVAVALGLILVVPLVLSIIGPLVHANWPLDVNAFLPSQAGGQLFSYDVGATQDASSGSGIALNGWQGFGVIGAEVVAIGCIALTLVKSRDA